MNFSKKIVFGKVVHWWANYRRNGLAHNYVNDEAPLRDELFSSDQMKQHGKALAASHRIALGRAHDRLLTRLAENEDVLVGTCNLERGADAHGDLLPIEEPSAPQYPSAGGPLTCPGVGRR